MKKISSILMLMLLTVSTFGNVIAQSDNSEIDNMVKPEGLFANLMSNLKILLTFNPVDKAGRLLDSATDQLVRMDKYKDSPKQSDIAKKNYKKIMKKVEIISYNLGKNGKNPEDVMKKYSALEKQLLFHELKAKGIGVKESEGSIISAQLDKIPMNAIAALGKIEPADMKTYLKKGVISEEETLDGGWEWELFIRRIIARIKDSDMDSRSKYLLFQRIRYYIDTRTSGDGNRDSDFLIDLVVKIKDSDMDREAKFDIYESIKKFLKENQNNEKSNGRVGNGYNPVKGIGIKALPIYSINDFENLSYADSLKVKGIGVSKFDKASVKPYYLKYTYKLGED